MDRIKRKWPPVIELVNGASTTRRPYISETIAGKFHYLATDN